MFPKGFAYEKESGKMQLKAGDRVVFTIGAFPQDKQTHPEEIDMTTREAVVYDFRNDNGYNSTEIVIFVLDFPLNDRPTTLEFNLSATYGIPGDGYQTKCLTKTMIKDYVKKLDPKQCRSPIPLYKCVKCSKINKSVATAFFHDLGHICLDHIIPWNEQLACPDVMDEACQEMLAIFSQKSSADVIDSVTGPSAYAVTKALARSKVWKNVPHENKRSRFDELVMKEFFMIRDRFETVHRVLIRDLDQQLFTGKASRKATYDSWLGFNNTSESMSPLTSLKEQRFQELTPQKILPQRLLAGLKNKGFGAKEFEVLKNNQTQYEIDSMDIETAIVLIASLSGKTTKESNGRNSSELVKTPNPTRQYVDAASQIPLRKRINILFTYPMLQKEIPCFLDTQSTYSDMMSQAHGPIHDRSYDPGNEMVLYRLSTNQQIVPTNSDPNDTRYASFHDLGDGDIVIVRNTLDNVGLKLPIETLSTEYQSVTLSSKMNDLSTVYESWRSVRGDGNCYYRAVIFGLIEQIITSNQIHLFNHLAMKFEECVHDQDDGQIIRMDSSSLYTDGPKYLTIVDLCALLRDAAMGITWLTIDEFEGVILDPTNGVDIVLIRACRELIGKYLMSHANADINGLPLSEAILPSYPDVSSMEGYCMRYVRSMGEDAEGPLVFLSVLPRSLGCSAITVAVDRREDVMTNVFESVYEEYDAIGITIHLLLRPGHYDVLYQRSSWERNNQDLSSIFNQHRLKPNKLLQTTKTSKSSSIQDKAIEIENIPVNKTVYPILSMTRHNRVAIVSAYSSLLRQSGLLVYTEDSNYSKSVLVVGNTFEEINQRWSLINSIDSRRIQYYINQVTGSFFDDWSSISKAVRLCPVIDDIITVHLTYPSFNQSKSNGGISLMIDKFLVTTYSSVIDQLCKYHSMVSQNRSIGLLNSNGKLIENLSELVDQNAYQLCPLYVTNVFVRGILHHTKHLSFIQSAQVIKQDILKDLHLNLSGKNVSWKWALPSSHSDEDCYAFSDDLRSQDLNYYLHHAYDLHITYCDCPLNDCQSRQMPFIKDVIKIEDGCSHTVCQPCLLKCLSDLPAREVIGADLYEDADPNASISVTASASSRYTVKSIFRQPILSNEVLVYEPQLRPISCPVKHCGVQLTRKTLAKTAVYDLDYCEVFTELDRYQTMLRSCRDCGLQQTYYCDGQQPRHRLIQLGCEHFFHYECLAGWIANKANDYKRLLSEWARIEETPFQCPVCVESKKGACGCAFCMGSRVHNITPHEASSLIDRDPVFTKALFDDYERISSIQALRTSSDDGDLVSCNRGGCHEYYMIPRTQNVLNCNKCGSKTCLLCKADAHPNQTCDQASAQRSFDAARSAGVILQCCPKCFTPGTIPKDCYHITCMKKDCEQQYCLLCAAPYSPTTAHNNTYHRPQCSYYNPICCDKRCIEEGKPLCVDGKYQPGPCADCRGKPTSDRLLTTNKCTHNNWKPCSDCVRAKRECFRHHIRWCLECERLGTLCSPPAAATDARLQIIPKDVADAEQKRLEVPTAA